MGQNEKDILLQKLADATRKLNLLTEQLEIANRKLKEYEEKALTAEKASQMKSLFLANMSHEIRTPLNAIEGFTRIIVETDSEEDRMKYYQIVESNNQRLSSLINEILDLSRVESGEIQLKKEMTDINQLCENIKQLFKFRCPESVKLEFEKPMMTATMNTDANRLIQVFSNLISNALKHTAMGSITYGFRVINEMSDIEFFVKDTGSGIEPEFIDNIFNTYASQDAEQQKGYGLGLALCKIIVEKMGGTIRVDSTVNVGSTFTFKLPFQPLNRLMGQAVIEQFEHRGNNSRNIPNSIALWLAFVISELKQMRGLVPRHNHDGGLTDVRMILHDFAECIERVFGHVVEIG